MSDQLFPVFDVPDDISTTDAGDTMEPQSDYQYDQETGEFATDGAGRILIASERDAWITWCTKCAATERGASIAYSDQYGIDFDEVRLQETRAGAETVLTRTITEALLIHPMTESVREFEFEWEGDEMRMACNIYPKDGEAQQINLNYRI